MKKNLLMKKIAITTCNIRFICKYMLHLCTIKSPTSSAFISSKGNSYHALEKCEGVHLCTIKSPTSSAFISSKGNSYHALEKCEGVKGAKFLFFISFLQSFYFL
jgi:hypothetical protein